MWVIMPFTIAQMPAKTSNEAARVSKKCQLVPDLLVLARLSARGH